jgi:hypothetical protein
MAASTCQGPLVRCPGKKSGCRPWWPQPGSGAQAQAVYLVAGPDHRIGGAEQQGLPDQRGVPGVGGVKADADDASLLPLLADSGIPFGDDGAGQLIQAGRQGSHDIAD